MRFICLSTSCVCHSNAILVCVVLRLVDSCRVNLSECTMPHKRIFSRSTIPTSHRQEQKKNYSLLFHPHRLHQMRIIGKSKYCHYYYYQTLELMNVCGIVDCAFIGVVVGAAYNTHLCLTWYNLGCAIVPFLDNFMRNHNTNAYQNNALNTPAPPN